MAAKKVKKVKKVIPRSPPQNIIMTGNILDCENRFNLKDSKISNRKKWNIDNEVKIVKYYTISGRGGGSRKSACNFKDNYAGSADGML